MSATNRGSKRSKNDFYATPLAAFAPLIPYLRIMPGPIWEPACGDARLIRTMLAMCIPAAGDDLGNGYDFLNQSRTHPTILTNPPFSLAHEFCDHAIRHAPNVFMLLRLNFLGSSKRRDWWLKHPVSAIFIITPRPSFTGKGSDACEYGWFYWGNIWKGIYHL